MTTRRYRGTHHTLAEPATRIANGSVESSLKAEAESLRVQLDVTAALGTLDVVIEDSLDDGANWNVMGAFAQKTAPGREVINITIPFTPRVRVRWTLGGVNPSFTFSVVAWMQ